MCRERRSPVRNISCFIWAYSRIVRQQGRAVSLRWHLWVQSFGARVIVRGWQSQDAFTVTRWTSYDGTPVVSSGFHTDEFGPAVWSNSFNRHISTHVWAVRVKRPNMNGN